MCLSISKYNFVFFNAHSMLNRVLLLNIPKTISTSQSSLFSTSSIVQSWFVRLTNVTQVNSEAAVPKHTRKRNYPLTCEKNDCFYFDHSFETFSCLEKMNNDNFQSLLVKRKVGTLLIHRIFVMENVNLKLSLMICLFVNLFMEHGTICLHQKSSLNDVII